MPELTLEQVRALRAGITPGEWHERTLLTASENHAGYVVVSRDFAVARVVPVDEDGVEGGANAQAIAALPDVLAALEAALMEVDRLRGIFIEQDREIEQVLGQALGFPWYKDDQISFPGATESDGVCVGEYTAPVLAQLAATRIQELETEATTRESVRRNAGTHRLLRELGD